MKNSKPNRGKDTLRQFWSWLKDSISFKKGGFVTALCAALLFYVIPKCTDSIKNSNKAIIDFNERQSQYEKQEYWESPHSITLPVDTLDLNEQMKRLKNDIQQLPKE